jgi:DNA (cytosine-5)-methyltransferase 1
VLLSLFCGAGGLDLGFEQAGFDVGLAFDRNAQSVNSYNWNRLTSGHGLVRDVTKLTPSTLDKIAKTSFIPRGIIGGPPCQSFSQANVNQSDDDPRHVMPLAYARLLASLNRRNPVDFFVLENVVGLTAARHRSTLEMTKDRLEKAGFNITQQILNASDFGTPQTRPRLFIVGYNRQRFGSLSWLAPAPSQLKRITVRETIGGLPKPTFFRRGINPEEISFHRNHWCMTPKSPKFFRKGGLKEGLRKGRSFKTLMWDSRDERVGIVGMACPPVLGERCEKGFGTCFKRDIFGSRGPKEIQKDMNRFAHGPSGWTGRRRVSSPPARPCGGIPRSRRRRELRKRIEPDVDEPISPKMLVAGGRSHQAHLGRQPRRGRFDRLSLAPFPIPLVKFAR